MFLRKCKPSFIDLVKPLKPTERKRRIGTLRGREDKKTSIIDVSISTINLITWAFQCASAMEYLSLKNIVHGDLGKQSEYEPFLTNHFLYSSRNIFK
jgi:hypothetical protein